MISKKRNVATLVVKVLAVLLAFPTLCWGGVEPHVTFKVEDGWIALTLRKQGQPIADADLRIIDERGGAFASGQTGVSGESTFPMPPGKSFLVEVKIGERISDPIRIYQKGAEVEPSRVLLSFGLKPCCRNVYAKQSAEGSTTNDSIQLDDTSSPWIFVFAQLLLASAAVGVWLVLFRHDARNSRSMENDDSRSDERSA